METKEIAEQILEVTPVTMGGYGLALVVLAIVAFISYKLYKQERKYSADRAAEMKDMHGRTVEVLTEVSTRLEDQKEMHDDIKWLRQHIDEVIIKTH